MTNFKRADPMKQWEQNKNNDFSIIGDGKSIFNVGKTTFDKGEYAGLAIQNARFGSRFIAHMVDGLLVNALIYIISLLELKILGYIRILLIIVYYAMFEGSNKQATLGKQLFGLRVINVDGGKLSYARAALRGGLMMAVPALILQIIAETHPFLDWRNYTYLNTVIMGFDCIFILWTGKNQAIHDLIARCMVIQVPKVKAIDNELVDPTSTSEEV